MGVFERLIVRLENFGYFAANSLHKSTVTILFLGSVYGFYALLRDYRAYFKLRRSPEYENQLKLREEIIRKIVVTEDKQSDN
jgi:hypothetical protein